MADPIVVMVTCSTYPESEQIAAALLEDKLAACVKTAGRVRSLFEWKGTTTKATEFLLMIVTERDKFDALEERVKELHSYECPEVLGLPVIMGSANYLKWISDSLEQAE